LQDYIWHNAGFTLKTPLPRQTAGWLRHPFLIAAPLQDWLVHCGSLTRRLKQRCRAFSVEKVSTRIRPANPDEERELGLRRGQYAYVREVVLYCDGQAVVFAHSVIPLKNLRGPWSSVTRLGSRPLGEALFTNHLVRRHPLSHRTLHPHHKLYRETGRAVAVDDRAKLLARRSRFSLKGRALMVTEVFLPAILDLGDDFH
jgi:chorismate--pyruvate lyase